MTLNARPRFHLHQPVTFRRHSDSPLERGRVVSMTYGRLPCQYEVEGENGERITDPVDVEAAS